MPENESKKRININEATPEELKTLPSVGPAIADEIIEHRTNVGPFEKREDLMEIRGISVRVYWELADRIMV